jgi:hypothetical protein
LFDAHVGLLLPKPEMQMSVLFAFVAPPLASPGLSLFIVALPLVPYALNQGVNSCTKHEKRSYHGAELSRSVCAVRPGQAAKESTDDHGATEQDSNRSHHDIAHWN